MGAGRVSGDPANVLVVGRGGREHALAWSLASSQGVRTIWVAPGNGGTAAMGGKVANVAAEEHDFPRLIEFSLRESIGLAVIGPEAPLAAGIADAFLSAGIACFGPTKAAARLESSKAFAKDFMHRHKIPTARYAVFCELASALAHLRRCEYRVVIKASGLAAGKGVVLPETAVEAETILTQMLSQRMFGAASEEVLIEERIAGPEASMLAFCDGHDFAVMPVAQDHKRAFDADLGPNTGGMGAYAPAPIVTPALRREIETTILKPTLAGMAAEGAPFSGVLYAGLMLTSDGPRVIEFNCRFGDPETQVILPLLDCDLVKVLMACTNGTLADAAPRWRAGTALAVVAASGGYPGEYKKGLEISGVVETAAQPDTLVFHAGTFRDAQGRLLTDGGRVLAVTGLGANLAGASARAYGGLRHIQFEGMHFRRDIGAKAI